MSYTMCDCAEYEGPHDPSIRCVWRAKRDERARCVRVLRQMASMARARSQSTGADRAYSFSMALSDALMMTAFELAATCLEEDKP